jgi:hypothetical protein
MRSRDKPGGSPVYWLGGVRHRGGASLFCGFCTERGKAGPILASAGCRVLSGGGGWREGERLAAETAGRGVLMRNPLADRLVVALRLL